MGARKQFPATGRQSRGGLKNSSKTRLISQRTDSARSASSVSGRSSSAKSSAINSSNTTSTNKKSEKKSTVGGKQKTNLTSAKQAGKKDSTSEQIDLSSSGASNLISRPNSPKNLPSKKDQTEELAQQPVDVYPIEDKSKAINKMLKSLDIKISGFNSIATDEKKVAITECKASISEIVKTKSRAAATKSTENTASKLKKDKNVMNSSVTCGTIPTKLSSINCSSNVPSKNTPITKDSKAKNSTVTANNSGENCADPIKREIKSKSVGNKDETSKSTCDPLENVEECNIPITTANTIVFDEKDKLEKEMKISISNEKNECLKKNSCSNSTNKLKKGKKNIGKEITISDSTVVSLKSAKATIAKSNDEKPTQQKQTQLKVKTTNNKNALTTAKKNSNCSSNKNNERGQEKIILSAQEDKDKLQNKSSSSELLKENETSKLISDAKGDNESLETDANCKLNEIQIGSKKGSTEVLTLPPKNTIKTKLGTKSNEKGLNFVVDDNKNSSKIEDITQNISNRNEKSLEVIENSNSIESIIPGKTFEKDINVSCGKKKKPQAGKGKEKFVPNENLSKTVKAKSSNPSQKDAQLKKNSQSRLLAVRERLQKKYVHAKLAGFKSFKTQTKKLEKLSDADTTDVATGKNDISSNTPMTKESAPVVNTGSTRHEKDVYDFKTESESDDNIKMNLLNETRILPKFRTEKEYSDEDDKPLHLTKLELKEEKDEKEANDIKKPVIPKLENKKSTPVKKSPVKVREEKKTGKNSKKVTISNKRKDKTSTSDGESDTSDTDESSKTKINDFGQRRHRMASLNALAKVQCLYENESRTAHELGLSKSTQVPKMRLINTSGSEEEKDIDKKTLETKEVKKEPPSQLGSESENKRELRNAPGLRGVGKHWDFDDVSTSESGHESDHAMEIKAKTKKRKISKIKAANQMKEKDNDTKEKSNAGNKTALTKQKANSKIQKKKARSPSCSDEFSNSSSDEGDRKEIANCTKKSTGNKRKRDKLDDIGMEFKGVLARKRMASLNASALVAATYDIERHLDRNFNSDCSSFESFPEDEKPKIITPLVKTKVKEIKKDKSEENIKDIKESTSRPTSSSVVIVQDTDVTITGVYVNSSTGSSQEAYCKMQYRVQSSVTEERVLRPNSIDPPKSYTPLGALSSMRPPGAAVPEVQSTVAPPSTGTLFQPSGLESEQNQSMSNPHLYAAPTSTHRHPSSAMIPPGHMHTVDHSQGFHHHHHHLHPGQSQSSQIPLKYPHHHHLHSQQPSIASPSLPHHPTPISQGRCESPTLTSGHYPLGGYHPIQPASSLSNPATISSGSSAFCPPIQQSHHDIAGYYQPAGPLISPHLLSSVPPPPSNASLVSSTKRVPSPLDSESDHHQIPQQPSSAASAGESSDSEVLITGGDLSTFRYPSQAQHQQQQQQQQQLSVLSAHQQQQQAQSQNSPYSRSMHQMHYPPSYPPSYYSPYPGDAMCYSPPYQPYFPAKVYQSSPAYRRYPYYQPGPPSDLYDPPPPSSAGAQSGSQLVPAGPAGPQHIEHYPGPPGFYSGYSPGGGQCYSRGLQPPYMEYPPPCPCPMQSCPKNVLTGPLIGSSNSGSSNSINNNTNTVANNSSSISNGMNTINNNNSNTIMNNSSSNNSNSIMNHNMSNSNGSIFNNTNNSSSINHTSSSLKNLNQSLKTGKGPVQQHQQNQQLSPQMKSHNHLLGTIEQQSPISNESLINKSLLPHHHHMHQCKMELVDPINTSLKQEITNAERMSTKNDSKENQYEEVAVPPTSPNAKYTLNDKLIEPETTVSPARGSTGLPTIPDQDDKAASINPAAVALLTSNNIPQTTLSTSRENIDTAVSTNMPSVIGRKARIGKSMAREMMYGAHAIHHNTPSSGNTISSSASVIPILGGTPSSAATPSSSVSLGITPTSVQHQSPSLHHQHQMYSNNHNQYHHYHHHHILPSNGNNDSSALTDPKTINEHSSPVKTEMNKTIKQELIKTEEEDVVVILDDEKKIKTEPEIIEVFDDSRTSESRRTADMTVETDIINSASINNNNNNNNSNKAPQLSQVNCNNTVTINDFEDIELPRQSLSLKRMKILELNKSQCKKSPPNGYKSLIKQTEPKPYLCLSKKLEHRKDRFMTITSKNGVRKRKLMLTEHQKKRLLLRKRKLMLLDKRRQAQMEVCEESKITTSKSPLKDLLYNNNNINNNNNNNVVEKVEDEIKIVEIESSQNFSAVKATAKENSKEGKALKLIENGRNDYKLSIKSTGQMPNDVMARGYFSEPEIITTKSIASNRRPRKTERISESRSKSETKKPSKTEDKMPKGNNAINVSVDKEENKLEQGTVENNTGLPLTEMPGKDNFTPTFVIDSSNDEALVTESKINSKTSTTSRKKMKRHHKKPTNRRASKSTKSPFNEIANNAPALQKNESLLEEHSAFIENTTVKQTPTGLTTINNNNIVVLESNNNKNILNSNNDSILFEENHNVSSIELLPVSISPTETVKARKNKQQQDALNKTLPFLPLPQPTTVHKRARSRTKFGSRKRQRTRHCAVMNEVVETIIPRKLNVVPKWNNGWSWEGEPYQGKVFLNSDDPLVLRTCYPAMRHLQGDLVRPRDCVLLRAGSKRNELPYVAKVAHLWENPEDGEMMMSLLWYYRPEHTEQGRQANDCADEVFASRHRDHNSVACIEDKCYVLTFSEYCRYRRSVRGSEEGVDDQISIVPSLQNYSNPREVPINTNPELVLFCQRVYDFRLKRLMKTPNNN